LLDCFSDRKKRKQYLLDGGNDAYKLQKVRMFILSVTIDGLQFILPTARMHNLTLTVAEDEVMSCQLEQHPSDKGNDRHLLCAPGDANNRIVTPWSDSHGAAISQNVGWLDIFYQCLTHSHSFKTMSPTAIKTL